MAVRDPQRSARFYQAVVGAQPVYQQQDFIQAQTPGSRDVLVFERRRSRAGRTGGVAHFGFRLKRAADIAMAVHAIVAAGGRVRDQGEFVPGEPYVFFTDPDGYEVEIWYELPTPLDPPGTGRGTTRPTLKAPTGKAQRSKSTRPGTRRTACRPARRSTSESVGTRRTQRRARAAKSRRASGPNWPGGVERSARVTDDRRHDEQR